MNSLPRLDTSGKEEISNSPRNSFASATDYDEGSIRNSYSSASEASSISSRTSYSSLQDSFGRVSSFSRTSGHFVPESSENTPISPGVESGTIWKGSEHSARSDQTQTQDDFVEIKGRAKDGFTALRELGEVRNVMCVAFGAFDRYYLSWEDNDGQFHQDGNKLPKCLQKWLYPADGSTRHLPSLQVSFGSNDEFFASDENGKLSSRDQCCQPEQRKVPKLAEVTRGIIRQKSHTLSNSTTPSEAAIIDPSPPIPRLKRRSTLQMDSQVSDPDNKQSITPLGDRPQLTRWDSRPDGVRSEKRRSIFGSISSRALSSESILEGAPQKTPADSMPVEAQAPVDPTKIETKPPQVEVQTESLVSRLRRTNSVDTKQESPQERRVSIFANRPPLRKVSVELKPTVTEGNERRGLFAGMLARTPMREPKPEAPKEEQGRAPFINTLRKTSGVTKFDEPKSISINSVVAEEHISGPQSQEVNRDIEQQQEPTRIEIKSKLQTRGDNQRIIGTVSSPQSSWSSTRDITTDKKKVETIREPINRLKSYADASVQTDFVEETFGLPYLPSQVLDVPVYIPPPHAVSIGSMSDFFRGSYSRGLGDALRYV